MLPFHARSDFRLQQGSLAAKIGFGPWNSSAAGPHTRTANRSDARIETESQTRD